MVQNATVTELDGQYATVNVVRKSACDACTARRFCEGGKCMNVKVINEIGAKVGDSVQIYSPDSKVLAYAALVFMLPILLGLAFYFAFRLLHENVGVAAAIVGFLAPLITAVVINSKYKNKLHAKIIAINDENETNTTNND